LRRSPVPSPQQRLGRTLPMSRTSVPNNTPEELPYRIELWHDGGREEVERVLARALSAQLAHAIFQAAKGEHPHRRITLSTSDEILADSATPPPD